MNIDSENTIDEGLYSRQLYVVNMMLVPFPVYWSILPSLVAPLL